MASLSELYRLDPNRIDFVNLDLADDLPLFVDPLLFWRSPYPEHHAVHAVIVDFFERAIECVRAKEYSVAKRMLVFPEPTNYIGCSRAGHEGHGIARDLGKKLYEELIDNPDIQAHGLKFLNELELLIEGIGGDLISDMAVNIAKPYFVEYTGRECRRWNIPLHKAVTRCFLYEERDWDDVPVELPLHPETGSPFLLTPYEVVRKFVDLNSRQFYQEALRHILRDRMVHNFEALGKTPRVTWREVQATYPFSKRLVVRTLHESPDLRREFVGTRKQDTEGRGRELTAKRLGLAEEPQLSLAALQDIARSHPPDAGFPALLDAALHLPSTTDAPPPVSVPFTDDLNRVLKRSMEELVLLLGSYAADQKENWEKGQTLLETEGYSCCILRDMPDLGDAAPREKVFTYASAARFMVVFDFSPSGHLNEIELLKSLGRPMAIIGSPGAGSTFMLAGIERISFIRRFEVVGGVTLEQALVAAIDWAEETIKGNVELNFKTLPWMKRVLGNG